MAYPCNLVEQEAQPTLVVRTRAPVQRLPQVLGPAWGAVMACAGKQGAAPSGPPFVAYHNMDMDDLDLEIGFGFGRPLVGEGDVQAGEISAGEAAACLHVGPYDRVSAAYDALHAWLAAHGRTTPGPAYEYYLNDPQVTPPTELQTRVVMPLR